MHTSSQPPGPSAPSSPLLTGLGQALRWLRERQARKQYRVAADAGITKGMLSAYETGRQRPSLDTLDKLLETLGSDLNDLHNALQIVNGRPELMKGWTRFGDELMASPGAASEPSLISRSGRGSWPSGSSPHPWAAGAPFSPTAPLSPLTPISPLGPLGPLTELGPPGSLPAPRATPPGHPAELHEPAAPPYSGTEPYGRSDNAPSELARLLGPDQLRRAPLAAEEELALAQMLEGFHSLLRYWHRALAAMAEAAASAPQGDLVSQDAPTGPPAGTPRHRGHRAETASKTASESAEPGSVKPRRPRS